MKTLSLIHGWGIGSCAWQTLTAQLGTNFKLQIIDLPGYGKNPGRNDDFLETTQNIAKSIPPDSIVCGWSLGGIIAMQLALLAPQRIAGLIVIAASPCFTKRDDWPQAQPPELLSSFAQATSKDPVGTLQRFNVLLNRGDSLARSTTRQLAQAMSTAPCPERETLLRGLSWLRDIDLRPQIEQLNVPALLIHGDMDQLMPLSAAQWLDEKLPASHLEIINGAAHAPFINHPEQLARIIGDFCSHGLAKK